MSYECTNEGGWNHRVVATYDSTQERWLTSVREVYYKNHKIEGWTENETRLICDTDPADLHTEVEAIGRAFMKPLLIEDGDKLVMHTRRAAAFVKESELPTNIYKSEKVAKKDDLAEQ